MSWPPENPTRIALVAVAIAFAAGTIAILVSGASGATFGTLILGCVALGTILATTLDRRTPGAPKR